MIQHTWQQDVGPTLSDPDGYVARSGVHLQIDKAHLQYVTVALIQHTCNTLQLQLARSHVPSACPIITVSSLLVFDRGGVLDVTCESWAHACPVVSVSPCLGNRGLGIHLHAREKSVTRA
jgi:hypothetical protein